MSRPNGYRSASLLLVLAMLVLLAGCAPAAPQAVAPTAEPAAKPVEKDKVAILMAVSCDDSGWGTPGCEGIKQAAAKHNLEYSISENVAIADAEAAVRDYAARGYKLIIGHGFQYGDAIKVVAPDFPTRVRHLCGLCGREKRHAHRPQEP